MAQISYGTITITDITDIGDVYLEYCMVEAGKTTSQVEAKSTWVSPEVSWSTVYPTWQNGYEIWVRQVQIREGIESGIYTIQFSATTTNSVIFRLHGYDSNGQWLRQLFTTTITSTSTLPIVQTLELPSDIKFVRLSYPLTGVENTGIFKGESTSDGTGLIDISTNESGSIPASGTPASNSSFNRTQLIAVYPQGYGTPYLDTAVNQIANSIYTINTNVINLDNRLKAFFWPGDSSYSGAFAVAKTSDDGLDVSNANTYGFNTRVATGLVSIGYNKIPLSEWGINEGLKMYYPISDNETLIDNKLGMQLTANTLNLYNPTLSYIEYNGKTENENPQELRLYEYSTLDNVYILTTDTTFHTDKTYYENDVIKGLEIDGTGMTIYDVDEKPIITAKNTIFNLGFDLAELSDNFDPYSAGNENPFIIWQKKENINYLYEFLDDIIIKDSQRDSKRYSLKQEIDIIENNIATNANDIDNIISNHIPLINSNISRIDNLLNLANNNISTNTSNISTNANNISINTSNISIINARINKIKAYWKINTNNHLILIEEGL